MARHKRPQDKTGRLRSASPPPPQSTSTSTVDESQEQPSTIIHLDGRTLEGGGQLVRNSLALSALTGVPVSISHIRGNRKGKTGLKGSHAAAVKFLTEMCEGDVRGETIGSTELTFFPRGRKAVSQSPAKTKMEYEIKLSTAGSVFLVFQAVYPYLLHKATGAAEPVRLSITGGTNVSYAPSYDYVEQVLVPNLRRIGLPSLSVQLHGRGWSTGPMDLGAVTFQIHPLLDESAAVEGATKTGFPRLNLSQYRRASVTRIDITILAPDTELRHQEAQGTNRRDRRAKHQRGTTDRHIRYDDDDGVGFASDMTIRDYLEKRTQQAVHRVVKHLPETVVPRDIPVDGADLISRDGDRSVPIQLHTSQATRHHTHLYILLVAHTSNGLRIGTDALFDGFKDRRSGQQGRHRDRQRDSDGNILSTLDQLVESCVAQFADELQGRGYSEGGKCQPCVDVHMRDQLVIFDALGRHGNDPGMDGKKAAVVDEDERYWSLHTQTAQWVCERILGEDIWARSSTSTTEI
jgi:RNA 3'-terminal phosphate cyclase (ATP)